MGGSKKRSPQKYLTGIDDSGGHGPLVDLHGAPRKAADPFVGIASVTVAEDIYPDFEGNWNSLRRRIMADLGLESPPPIHLRWMWGTRRPDKHKNPYLHASREQVADWLTEAVGILMRFQFRRYRFGMQGTFLPRAVLAAGTTPYYASPEFMQERAYLASRGVPRGLYRKYQQATEFPLLRILPHVLWSVDQSVQTVGGTEFAVEVDAFTGTDGIGAGELLRVTRDLAGIQRLVNIDVVPAYADSPLVQAADLVAWAMNRGITQQQRGEVDSPFLAVFRPILEHGRSLSGSLNRKGGVVSADTTATTLCIAYALARKVAHDIEPGFVDDVFISVDDFHERAIDAMRLGAPGVSILTPLGVKRATEHAALNRTHPQQMTGPRSETAAE